MNFLSIILKKNILKFLKKYCTEKEIKSMSAMKVLVIMKKKCIFFMMKMKKK